MLTPHLHLVSQEQDEPHLYILYVSSWRGHKELWLQEVKSQAAKSSRSAQNRPCIPKKATVLFSDNVYGHYFNFLVCSSVAFTDSTPPTAHTRAATGSEREKFLSDKLTTSAF